MKWEARRYPWICLPKNQAKTLSVIRTSVILKFQLFETLSYLKFSYWEIVEWERYSATRTRFSFRKSRFTAITFFKEFFLKVKIPCLYYAQLEPQSLDFLRMSTPLRLSWKPGWKLSFSVIRTPGYSKEISYPPWSFE